MSVRFEKQNGRGKRSDAKLSENAIGLEKKKEELLGLKNFNFLGWRLNCETLAYDRRIVVVVVMFTLVTKCTGRITALLVCRIP
jgi:hypothetical protein